MTIPILTLGLALALAVVAFVRPRALVTSLPTRVPSSPIDEAERILARRYVRHEITAEEYERMLAVLRR